MSIYKQFMDLTGEGMISVDEKGNITYLNCTMAAMIGSTVEEMTGLSIFSFMEKNSVHIWKKNIENNKSGIKEEYSFLHKNGKKILTTVCTSPFMDENGMKVYLSVIQDITEKKIREEKLKETIEKYKVLFESFPLGISITDREGNIIEVNKESERLLGISRDDHLKRRLVDNDWSIVKSDGTPMSVEEFPACISLKEKRLVENIEMGFKKEDGGISWLSVTAAPIPLEKYGVAITYGDITERKKSENSLRESEKNLNTILKAAPAGIGFTCKRVIKRVNDRLLQMTGYSEEELIGQNARILYDNDMEFDRVGTVKYKQIRETGTGSIETQWKHKNGDLIDVYLSSTAINKENLLEGVIFTALDITEMKKGERLLRESKDRYSFLYNNTPVMLHSTDGEGHIISVSDYWLEAMGYDRNEVKGRKITDFLTHESMTYAIEKVIPEYMDKGFCRDIEYQFIKKNGEIIEGLLSAAFERDASGHPGRSMEVVIDITQRRIVEKKLQQSEEKLILGMKAANHGLWEWNITTGEAYFDPTYYTMLGYEPYEMPPGYDTWKGLLHPGDIQIAVEKIEEHLNNRKTGYEIDFRMKAKSGQWRWILGRGLVVERDEAGNPVRMIGTHTDITARKEIEEESRKLKDRFSKIFYLSPQIIALSTISEGKYLEVNDSFLKITGYEREEVIGNTVWNLNLWADVNDRNKVLELIRKEGAAVNCEIKFLRKDGTVMETLCSMVQIDMDGQDCLLALVVDISERKMMEEKLKMVNEELEKRVLERTRELSVINKELESFCYSVSHDLRAPLRSINGFSQALFEDFYDRLDEEGKDYLERIKRASQKMSDLIDDLLNLSRVTRSEINPVSVNMSELVNVILKDLHETEKERKSEFIIYPDVTVHGDVRLLKIALENLLGNAWKFTSKNDYTRIEFGTIKDKEKTVYFISDNGSGFDMAYGDKLFGPFQRLHSHEEFVGTGVGLATVQRIIHRHGGHIWAEGEVGKGAIFYFTIER